MSRIRRFLAAGFTVALVSAGALVVAAPVAQGATTLTPTTTADDGSSGSLRYLLELTAVDGDTIELEAGAVYTLDLCFEGSEVGPTVSLGDGDVSINAAVIIQGNGATIEQTCEGERVLRTADNLSLNNLTVTGGTPSGGGGGVRIEGGGTPLVFVLNSSIVGNCSGGSGGGIKMNANGNVIVANSTIAYNVADDTGGGLAHSHTGDVGILNSTISNNTADYAGGVDVRDGDLTTVYTDIVENTVTGVFDNCGANPGAVVDEDGDVVPSAVVDPANLAVASGHEWSSFATVVALPQGGYNCAVAGVTITSLGYNLADDLTCNLPVGTDKQGTDSAYDPKLGALAGNGGPTLTRLPQAGSPLIDAIPNAACSGGDAIVESAVTTDQRSYTRPSPTGGACDIGAVEIQVATPPVVQPTFTG